MPFGKSNGTLFEDHKISCLQASLLCYFCDYLFYDKLATQIYFVFPMRTLAHIWKFLSFSSGVLSYFYIHTEINTQAGNWAKGRTLKHQQ